MSSEIDSSTDKSVSAGLHTVRRALAQSDEILVSAETLEAVSTPFAAGELLAVSLTGIARPLQGFTVD